MKRAEEVTAKARSNATMRLLADFALESIRREELDALVSP